MLLLNFIGVALLYKWISIQQLQKQYQASQNQPFVTSFQQLGAYLRHANTTFLFYKVVAPQEQGCLIILFYRHCKNKTANTCKSTIVIFNKVVSPAEHTNFIMKQPTPATIHFRLTLFLAPQEPTLCNENAKNDTCSVGTPPFCTTSIIVTHLLYFLQNGCSFGAKYLLLNL